MAKISPVSIKYIIHAKFEASGAIEKPDMIGAVFGQTEGLLGDDLEMRELQKSGKIGRIEVNIDYGEGKTTGEIEVPTAMDKTETTLIAAALETIERVGPTDTKITIEEIEDVRGSKRDYILERAKKLMAKFGTDDKEIDEMSEEIKDSAKLAKMQSYGTENIPCGDISGNELIIVEGRADVVNMLKKGIKNVIAMNGTKLPESVVELSKEKESVILFVDGDRGGNLIIKNVTENAKIDYIAMAPDGKEVEELTGKEALQALRKKVPAKEYKPDNRSRGVRDYKDNKSSRYDRRDTNQSNRKAKDSKDIKKMSTKEKDEIKENVQDLVGSKGALIFNEKLETIKKLPLGRLGSLDLEEDPYIIAIDGTATPRVIENCEKLGCSNLIASNFVNADTNINLVSI
ncbi:MAG TPA: DNA primase DnaG [Candidatus Pacearchaeota archaeon]|jgi:DNA primase|nr:DNA primase DnaG [Candidatus Pacearchaeota archaeon]